MQNQPVPDTVGGRLILAHSFWDEARELRQELQDVSNTFWTYFYIPENEADENEWKKLDTVLAAFGNLMSAIGEKEALDETFSAESAGEDVGLGLNGILDYEANESGQ
jgi:hypothetical protein